MCLPFSFSFFTFLSQRLRLRLRSGACWITEPAIPNFCCQPWAKAVMGCSIRNFLHYRTSWGFWWLDCWTTWFTSLQLILSSPKKHHGLTKLRLLCLITLAVTSSLCLGAQKSTSWLCDDVKANLFPWAIWLVWQHGDMLYNYAPVLLVNVSRPYILMRPHKTFGLGMR